MSPRLRELDSVELAAGFEGANASAAVGLDQVPRITRAIRFAAPARYANIDIALAGRWLDEDSFEITFDTIDTIDAGTLRFDFTGASVTVTLFEKTYLRTNLSFTGTNDVASAE